MEDDNWISFEDSFPEEAGLYYCVVQEGSVRVSYRVMLQRISERAIERKDTKAGDWVKLLMWYPIPTLPKHLNIVNKRG